MPYAEHARHLSNELSKETVDMVVSLCTRNYDLVERFYNVKRQILGLSDLSHIDRYTPLFPAEQPVSYEEAQRIVQNSFGQFSGEMRDRAAHFFADGWIDAEPRPGKQGGAFCGYVTPDTHPYVLCNYLNKIDDVMTLAHELGHGVHASLSREQTYFNFHGTLPLAELASTFGEMLVFENVVAEASLKDKLALYASKIEGVFATVFRQAALYRFEQRSHQQRREGGELSAEQFGDIWQDRAAIYVWQLRETGRTAPGLVDVYLPFLPHAVLCVCLLVRRAVGIVALPNGEIGRAGLFGADTSSC